MLRTNCKNAYKDINNYIQLNKTVHNDNDIMIICRIFYFTRQKVPDR